MRRVAWVALAFVLVVALAVLAASTAFAKRPPSEPSCLCPDVYDPVICSDGNTYPNFCYAGCAGATGCTRTGDI